MGQLPSLPPRRVIAALKKLGFTEERTTGSHHAYRHPDGRGTTVPIHAGSDVPKGTLRSIIRQIEITEAEFLKLL